MSTGLHPARESLHIPNLGNPSAYLPSDQHLGGLLPKPMSLSPRTFGMDDFGPMGFKTGLTPRVFSTGLTPRSGFTPRFTTGFTPRLGQSLAQDTNAFFSRNTGFSPRPDGLAKTGFTPKDMTALKTPTPLRFPASYAPKMPMAMPMQDTQMTPPMDKQQQQGMHMQQQPQDMSGMAMSMFDYMNRPAIPQQQQQPMMNPNVNQNASPASSDQAVDPDDLDERRRMKNRERVRKCRKRKQDRLNFLEERTAELEKENGALRTKLARKDDTATTAPLTDEQVNERRKKQNTALAAYVQAYNEANASSVDMRSVFADHAEVVYGHHGPSVVGAAAIGAAKTAMGAVFDQYKIRTYSAQWKDHAPDKCVVTWDLEVSLKPNAPTDIALTAPFADLARFVPAGRALSVQMVSHLTFADGQIVEELRLPNLAALADALLAEFATDPAVAAEVLRCLVKA